MGGVKIDGSGMAKASTRERLIDAAFALFAERGYEQTTVDDIAERAGVSRMTFFRTFRAKEDVIFPDHEVVLATVRDRLAAASPESADVAVAEAAGLVLRRYLDEGDVARQRYALTRSVPALHDREAASVRLYTELFRTFLEQTGSLSPLRADLLANAIVTAHNHVLRRWLRGQAKRPLVELDAAMAEVLALFRGGPDDDGAETAVLVVRTRRELDAALPRIQRLLQ